MSFQFDFWEGIRVWKEMEKPKRTILELSAAATANQTFRIRYFIEVHSHALGEWVRIGEDTRAQGKASH